MTDFLKGGGNNRGSKDSLNMDVNKPASWSAQDLRTRPVIPSGPAAFLTFPSNLVLRQGEYMIAALSAASWCADRQSRTAAIAFKAAVEGV